jgi:hypothetical protein
MARRGDKELLRALTKTYMARAKLFHTGIQSAKIDLLIAEIDGIDAAVLTWKRRRLFISETAWNRVLGAGGKPHQVFAHPDVIHFRPHLIAYYRNIVAISKKRHSANSLFHGRLRSRSPQRDGPDKVSGTL